MFFPRFSPHSSCPQGELEGGRNYSGTALEDMELLHIQDFSLANLGKDSYGVETSLQLPAE